MQRNYHIQLREDGLYYSVPCVLNAGAGYPNNVNDGRLNIDNNPVENSIRPVALERKNYLFAGSHEAATRSGMLYSLLGTCKINGVEPYAWLKDVLRVIADHPVNRIAELLLHRYKNSSLHKGVISRRDTAVQGRQGVDERRAAEQSCPYRS